MSKKERKKRVQNASYKILDEHIRNAYKAIIQSEKRIPSQAEVAKRCNIAERTVKRHLEKITLSDFVQPYRILGGTVLSALFEEAVSGNIQAMRLYFLLIFDWSERQEVKYEGEVRTIIEVRYEGEDKREMV